MNYEEREERLFLLRVFKFVFQLVSVALPPDLQKEYDKFPHDESSYFTDPMQRAVLILMNEKYDNIDDIPSIDSEDFGRITNELAHQYEPVDFLKFCSWFTMKAALGRCGETLNSYQAVWTAIENIFRIGRKNGGFDVDTWDTLDKVASRLVQEDDINYRRLPNFDPKAELNLEVEKAFVLRIMQHIFRYYSKEFPRCYDDNIRILDAQRFHLSENMQKALYCLIDILLEPKNRLGEDGLVDFYYRYNFDPFKERDFLEYCVCLSRKAYLDYDKYCQTSTPMQVFDSCVNVLRGVRRKGLPTPWRKIEDVATDILEEYECRLEDKRRKKQFLDYLLSNSKTDRDEIDPLELGKKDDDKPDDLPNLPKPDDMIAPKSSEIATPKPGDLIAPKSNEIATPKPGDLIAPKSSEIATPKPGDLISPKSSEIATPKPDDMDTLNPDEIVIRKPGDMITLKPGDVIALKPGDMVTDMLGEMDTLIPDEMVKRKFYEINTPESDKMDEKDEMDEQSEVKKPKTDKMGEPA